MHLTASFARFYCPNSNADSQRRVVSDRQRQRDLPPETRLLMHSWHTPSASTASLKIFSFSLTLSLSLYLYLSLSPVALSLSVSLSLSLLSLSLSLALSLSLSRAKQAASSYQNGSTGALTTDSASINFWLSLYSRLLSLSLSPILQTLRAGGADAVERSLPLYAAIAPACDSGCELVWICEKV